MSLKIWTVTIRNRLADNEAMYFSDHNGEFLGGVHTADGYKVYTSDEAVGEVFDSLARMCRILCGKQNSTRVTLTDQEQDLITKIAR